MAIFLENLEKQIIDEAKKSDKIIIITGYFSADMLKQIADTGIETEYYYGMYLKNGLSLNNKNYFDKIEKSHPNFQVYIPLSYHVHTKCYLFINNNRIRTAYVGSANCSKNALLAPKNSELLSLVDNSIDLNYLFSTFYPEIKNISVRYSNPSIICSSPQKLLKTTRGKNTPKSWRTYSGNPFSAIIPLYTVINGKPEVHNASGLNWGFQKGHTKKGAIYKEAFIPISAFVIDNHPTLIPYHGNVGSGSGGKITRRQDPIEVIWDDGTPMKMLFQGDGVERPTKAKRSSSNDIYKIYPKNFSASSGGEELGRYLRERMGLTPKHKFEYKDLIQYGRDYIVFSLTNSGNYEIDFHV